MRRRSYRGKLEELVAEQHRLAVHAAAHWAQAFVHRAELLVLRSLVQLGTDCSGRNCQPPGAPGYEHAHRIHRFLQDRFEHIQQVSFYLLAAP